MKIQLFLGHLETKCQEKRLVLSLSLACFNGHLPSFAFPTDGLKGNEKMAFGSLSLTNTVLTLRND